MKPRRTLTGADRLKLKRDNVAQVRADLRTGLQARLPGHFARYALEMGANAQEALVGAIDHPLVPDREKRKARAQLRELKRLVRKLEKWSASTRDSDAESVLRIETTLYARAEFIQRRAFLSMFSANEKFLRERVEHLMGHHMGAGERVT